MTQAHPQKAAELAMDLPELDVELLTQEQERNQARELERITREREADALAVFYSGEGDIEW